MSKKKTVKELPEDIEVIGPGQMLADARKSLGLTQEEVAEKLNFRKTLVKDIEQEIFDKKLPATFNRGYLKNYAKLVNAPVDDILASYETLNIAQKQGAEMQSFSKQTEKQAESNLIMWISYLILAVLIGATVVWWFQNAQQEQVPTAETSQQTSPTLPLVKDSELASDTKDNEISSSEDMLTDEQTVSLSEDLQELPSEHVISSETPKTEPLTEEDNAVREIAEQAGIAQSEEVDSQSALESVEFTFTGDCWVNIYDATGERIAWGVKKAGYVMTISGKAPFNITLGKPELVSIVYQQQTVDMSTFNQGNIAKFTLPLN